MAAAASTPTPIDLQYVPAKKVHESPFHRRKDWGDLEELAATIRSHGIVEPMLARPSKDGFELVFGHRRYRAGKLAELASYPCMVRELTDEEAVELMAIENLARKDLHPLEEAEGYEDLRKLGWSAERIADRVGKSLAYVYGRCKLLALIPEARKAFYEEQILPSVALYVARIPPQLQKEALGDLVGDFEWDGPMTARRAFEDLERRYLLRLADAPFDRGDAELVPAAGSCKDCPKRTGNQKELFADVKSADVCTDPTCFTEKNKAHAKRLLAAAEEKGQDVVTGDDAVRKAIGSGKYVNLADKNWDDKKTRTYAQLLKGADVPKVLAVQDDGTVKELVARADVAKALKLPKGKVDSPHAEAAERNKKAKEASDRKRVTTMALLGAVVEKAEKTEPTKAFWSFLARLLVRMASSDQWAAVLKRRGILEKGKVGARGFDYEHKLRAHLEQLPPEGARGLALELAASHGALFFGEYSGGDLGKSLLEAVAFYKIEKERVKVAALVAAKEKKAARKAKKAAKA